VDTCFIIPARGLAAGKSRLAGIMTEEERRELNEFMLRTVLRAVAAVRGASDGLLMVSPDAQLLAMAARYGAQAVHEGEPRGLNAALELGAQRARQIGAATLAVLPADLPFVEAPDISALLAGGAPGTSVVSATTVAIASDRNGTGTNALKRPVDAAIGFFFGAASFSRHVHAARAAGLQVIVVERTGLACDLDRPEDWQLWRERLKCQPLFHLE
jgi:2-phospho-L-lactate guanylyltransferase